MSVKITKLPNETIEKFLRNAIQNTLIKYNTTFHFGEDEKFYIQNIDQSSQDKLMMAVQVNVILSFNDYIEKELKLDLKKVNRNLPIILSKYENKRLVIWW